MIPNKRERKSPCRGRFIPNSAVQIIEERTWSGEDTQPYSFKVLSCSCLLFYCRNGLRTALMNVARLEAQCIGFVAESLLLVHDFVCDCGIRVHFTIARPLTVRFLSVNCFPRDPNKPKREGIIAKYRRAKVVLDKVQTA